MGRGEGGPAGRFELLAGAAPLCPEIVEHDAVDGLRFRRVGEERLRHLLADRRVPPRPQSDATDEYPLQFNETVGNLSLSGVEGALLGKTGRGGEGGRASSASRAPGRRGRRTGRPCRRRTRRSGRT